MPCLLCLFRNLTRALPQDSVASCHLSGPCLPALHRAVKLYPGMCLSLLSTPESRAAAVLMLVGHLTDSSPLCLSAGQVTVLSAEVCAPDWGRGQAGEGLWGPCMQGVGPQRGRAGSFCTLCGDRAAGVQLAGSPLYRGHRSSKPLLEWAEGLRRGKKEAVEQVDRKLPFVVCF